MDAIWKDLGRRRDLRQDVRASEVQATRNVESVSSCGIYINISRYQTRLAFQQYPNW